jgi:hypothetical protein
LASYKPFGTRGSMALPLMRLRLGGADRSHAVEDGDCFARIPDAGPVRLDTTKDCLFGTMLVRRSLYILNDARTRQ